MNFRAAARLTELGLVGYPTTFFDGGYGEILGGESDTALYTSQILSTGARDVTTDDLILTVELEWLGGEGGPDDDIEVTISIVVEGSLSFNFQDGVPNTIMPDVEKDINVVVAGTGTGVPVPGPGE